MTGPPQHTSLTLNRHDEAVWDGRPNDQPLNRNGRLDQVGMPPSRAVPGRTSAGMVSVLISVVAVRDHPASIGAVCVSPSKVQQMVDRGDEGRGGGFAARSGAGSRRGRGSQRSRRHDQATDVRCVSKSSTDHASAAWWPCNTATTLPAGSSRRSAGRPRWLSLLKLPSADRPASTPRPQAAQACGCSIEVTDEVTPNSAQSVPSGSAMQANGNWSWNRRMLSAAEWNSTTSRCPPRSTRRRTR